VPEDMNNDVQEDGDDDDNAREYQKGKANQNVFFSKQNHFISYLSFITHILELARKYHSLSFH